MEGMKLPVLGPEFSRERHVQIRGARPKNAGWKVWGKLKM